MIKYHKFTFVSIKYRDCIVSRFVHNMYVMPSEIVFYVFSNQFTLKTSQNMLYRCYVMSYRRSFLSYKLVVGTYVLNDSRIF